MLQAALPGGQGTRAQKHTLSHTHTHTHTHTGAQKLSLAHTHTHAHTLTHESTEALAHTREHRSSHACTHEHRSTLSHSHTHIHTREHRSSHAHTHESTEALSHTHTRAQKLSLYHTHTHTHTHTHMHTPHFLLGPATDRCLGPRWLDRLGQMAAWGWQPGPDPGLLSPDPPIPSVTCFRAAGGSSWDGCLCALGSFQGPARPLPEPHCPPPPVPARSLAPVHCGAWQVLLGTSARPAPCLWSRPVCLSALLSP